MNASIIVLFLLPLVLTGCRGDSSSDSGDSTDLGDNSSIGEGDGK